jgi:hypothetical protein
MQKISMEPQASYEDQIVPRQRIETSVKEKHDIAEAIRAKMGEVAELADKAANMGMEVYIYLDANPRSNQAGQNVTVKHTTEF